MSGFVLDCSVTMAWCFEDEADADADSVLDRLDRESALVPALWPLEVANVLLVAERRGRLSQSATAQFLHLLAALPIQVETRPLAPTELIVAGRAHGLSAYDAANLILAMGAGLPLASRDAALRGAAEIAGLPLLAAS